MGGQGGIKQHNILQHVPAPRRTSGATSEKEGGGGTSCLQGEEMVREKVGWGGYRESGLGQDGGPSAWVWVREFGVIENP